ncbi:CHRD domain-containing protein [Pyxidicoccus sp. 3LG]
MTMRKGMQAGLAVLALVVWGPWLAGCGTTEDGTMLSGSNEVPANSSTAQGAATAELDGDELVVTGEFSGLGSDLMPVSGSAAHIHNAPAGANGPIVFNLEVTTSDNRSGTFTGRKTLSDDEKTAFETGNFYVNIHTANYPMGEIRGQFDP